MHPRIRAQREAVAFERLANVASELARQFGLDVAELEIASPSSEPEVVQLLRGEAALDLLEAIVASTAPVAKTEIEQTTKSK